MFVGGVFRVAVLNEGGGCSFSSLTFVIVFVFCVMLSMSMSSMSSMSVSIILIRVGGWEDDWFVGIVTESLENVGEIGVSESNLGVSELSEKLQWLNLREN